MTTQWQYDDRLRMERLTSTRQSDGVVLQDREYDYDEVSNIAGITDRRSETHRSAILADLPQPTALSPADLIDSYSFNYDSLYRLTRANGQAQGDHGYRFDATGNLLSHTYQGDGRFRPPGTGTLTYGENGYGPHVLTGHASGTENAQFAYDANGNMTSDGSGAPRRRGTRRTAWWVRQRAESWATQGNGERR